jgi:hypothetical protein
LFPSGIEPLPAAACAASATGLGEAARIVDVGSTRVEVAILAVEARAVRAAEAALLRAEAVAVVEGLREVNVEPATASLAPCVMASIASPTI